MAEQATLESYEHRHQAEFAIKVFQRLSHDYSAGLSETPAKISINHLRSKWDLLAQLHSRLLPLLRQQIDTLSEVIWADSFRENPALTLGLVLDIQPKLEMTLDRIIRIINQVFPGPVHPPQQTNDQHFKQFKCFTLFGLVRSIRDDMEADLNSFFNDSCRRMRAFTLPKDHQVATTDSFVNALRSIDTVIRWSEGSELHIIYDLWQPTVIKTTDSLNAALIMADPENEDYTKSVRQLAKSFLPLIKLSKLFFKKMTSERLSKPKVSSCTEMSSHQLALLETSTETITDSLAELIDWLERTENVEPGRAKTLSGLIQNIISPFQSCLFLTNLYIIPIATDIDLGLSLIHYTAWCATWDTLFYQATHKAIKACESVQRR